jgi:nucleoside-diphosphate-sugar epimerase
MSYREAPSAVRAALAAADAAAGGPSQQLLESGEITGVVRIESCARVEWLLAAPRPAWAAELFGATLIGHADNPDHLRPRVRHGPAAAGDARRTNADISRIRADLGWEPRIPLAEGLVPTVEYFRRELGM